MCHMAGTMKFSEVPPYPYTCRSLHRVRTGKMWDFAVIRFSDFADAAFYCSRGTCVVATQRMSPMRSFVGVVLP